MVGWVKNYRKIEQWKFYRKAGYAHLLQHLIRKAQFTERYNINGQLVRRGEVDFSLRQLEDETGISVGVVRNILKELENNTVINTVHVGKNSRDLSIISIVNYDLYQSENEDTTQQTTRHQHSTNTAPTQHQHNFKKEKKEKKEKNNTAETSSTDIVAEIVEYLNHKKKSKRPFNPKTQPTQKVINARLRDGYSVDDFKAVINSKCQEWLGTEMEKYICPETLFRPSNFEKYLNACSATDPAEDLMNFSESIFSRGKAAIGESFE